MGILFGVVIVIALFWAIGNGLAKSTAQAMNAAQKTREQAPIVAAKTIKTSAKAAHTATKVTASALTTGARKTTAQIQHAKDNGQSGFRRFMDEVKQQKAELDAKEQRDLRVVASKAAEAS